MSEQPEDVRSVANTKQRMRPLPAGNGWALVVVATVVVILLGLGTWIGLSPLQTLLSTPSDHEAVHAVGQRMRARWPQAPGPPERYIAEAQADIRAGDGPGAARKLGMALALDADQAEALLRLSMLDARGQADGLLEPGEGDAIVGALSEVAAEAPLLPAARAWRALAADDAPGALAGLGPQEEGEPAAQLWARLRAQRAVQEPEGAAARALLAAWPGHPEACEDGAREALRSDAFAEALALAEGCRGGPADAIARRVQADVLARTGAARDARIAYREAGLHLHAAAVAVRTGAAPTEAERAALAEPGPAAAIQQAWAAMAAGDAELLGIAVDRIPAEPVPELAVTRAAAALWGGDAEGAARALEGVQGPRAAVLRAQIPGPGAAEAEAAARAAWPARPGGDDPAATWLLLGPSDHAVPTRLLLVVGAGAGTALDGIAPWAPADPDGRALIAWLEGAPAVAPTGVDGPVPAALGVAVALDAGGEGTRALGRLRTLAPDSVLALLMSARAAPDAEACVEAVAKAAEGTPGLVGLDRERYRCRVRGGAATPR